MGKLRTSIPEGKESSMYVVIKQWEKEQSSDQNEMMAFEKYISERAHHTTHQVEKCKTRWNTIHLLQLMAAAL